MPRRNTHGNAPQFQKQTPRLTAPRQQTAHTNGLSVVADAFAWSADQITDNIEQHKALAHEAYWAEQSMRVHQSVNDALRHHPADPDALSSHLTRIKKRFLDSIEDPQDKERARLSFDKLSYKAVGVAQDKQIKKQKNEQDATFVRARDQSLDNALQAFSEGNPEEGKQYLQTTQRFTELRRLGGHIDGLQVHKDNTEANNQAHAALVQRDFNQALITGGWQAGERFIKDLRKNQSIPRPQTQSLADELERRLKNGKKEFETIKRIQKVASVIDGDGSHHFDPHLKANRDDANDLWSREEQYLNGNGVPHLKIAARLLEYTKRLRYLPKSGVHYIRRQARGTVDQQIVIANLVKQIDALPGHLIGRQLSRDTYGRLIFITDMLEIGQTPEDTVTRATELTRLSKRQQRERYKPVLKKMDPVTENEIVDHFNEDIFEELEISSSQIAPIISQANEIYERQFILTGDQDHAKEYALNQIKKVYGVSQINGYKRLMKYPPETLYSMGDDDEWMAKDWRQNAQDLQKQGLIAKSIDIEKDVFLVTDSATARLIGKGLPPSWIIYAPNGEGHPDAILDTDGLPVRWRPDVAKELEKRKAHHQYKKLPDKTILKGITESSMTESLINIMQGHTG